MTGWLEEAIISHELFDEVQKILDHSKIPAEHFLMLCGYLA